MKTFQVTFSESPRFRAKGYKKLLEMGYPVREVGFFDAKMLTGSPAKIFGGNETSRRILQTLVRNKQNSNTENFSLAEICCYLGHLAAWNEFLKSGEKRCLIVEDDAMPLINCEELERKIETLQGFDAIQLVQRKGNWFDIDHPHFVKGEPCGYGLIAYILSQRGAKALIDQQNLKAADLKLMQLSMKGAVYSEKEDSFEHDWAIKSTIQGIVYPECVKNETI